MKTRENFWVVFVITVMAFLWVNHAEARLNCSNGYIRQGNTIDEVYDYCGQPNSSYRSFSTEMRHTPHGRKYQNIETKYLNYKQGGARHTIVLENDKVIRVRMKRGR